MRNLLAVFLIIVCLYSCQTSHSLIQNNPNSLSFNKETMYIYQDNKEQIVINKLDTINLKKAPFSIRCYNKTRGLNKYNATQIAVFLIDFEFNQIKTGVPTKDIPCFSPGTGYAMHGDGSDKYFLFETDLNSPGHHYLYYENMNSRRLNLIEELGELLKLEFEVNEFLVRNLDNTITETHISNTNIDKFYLALLIDRNLNDTIDVGELNKLIIHLE